MKIRNSSGFFFAFLSVPHTPVRSSPHSVLLLLWFSNAIHKSRPRFHRTGTNRACWNRSSAPIGMRSTTQRESRLLCERARYDALPRPSTVSPRHLPEPFLAPAPPKTLPRWVESTVFIIINLIRGITANPPSYRDSWSQAFPIGRARARSCCFARRTLKRRSSV